jgi:DivIVA domain-containing protein
VTRHGRVDLPAVFAFTADDAVVSIKSAIHYEVVNPRAAREVFDINGMVELAGVTVLRNSAAERSLEQILSSRAEVEPALAAEANGWLADRGVAVTRVEVIEVSASTFEALAADVAAGWRRQDFSTVLRGYDRGQVDDLLRCLSDAVVSNTPDRQAAVERALQEPLRIRFRGYDRVQVDGFIAHVSRLLPGL